MGKKKNKKEKKVLLNRKGEPIDPITLRARNLRASLLRRASTPEMKNNTPTIKELERFLNLPHYICRYSLEELSLGSRTIDHCVPIVRGGDNSLSNLCFSSSAMNTAKGSMTDVEFQQLLTLISEWEDGGEELIRRLRMGNNVFKR